MIFKDLQVSDKTAPKELLKLFKRAGAQVAQSSVEKTKRQNSVSFKTVHLTMNDSQLIDLRVKESGDIYQVLLNNKVVAMKNQDDDALAVAEIVKLWQTNANKFQAALANKKMALPTGVKSTRKKQMVLSDGKTYAYTGKSINDTGAIDITFATALPAGAKVNVVGLLNYEHAKLKDKRPVIAADARSYDLRATFTSAIFQATQEAQTQWNAEVRLDLGSEAMVTMQQQHAYEKHWAALRAMYAVGSNYRHVINLNSSSRQDQRSRESMWRDVLFKLTEADQAMVERTNAFGVGVIYVGSKGKAELSALPRDVFEPSVIAARAGIYRVGRLFGQYDVYYAPKCVNETADSLEMLCIGRSEQTGLNPYIVGDVVAPTFKKLNVDADLKEGAAYFYAGAARINPYAKAACGAAVVAVTGL